MAPKAQPSDVFKLVQRGDPDLLAAALKEDRGLAQETNKKKETPLHVACESGDVGCAEVLLAHNANPNVTDVEGRSALHLAVQRGYDDLVPILLAHGADAKVPDAGGLTPLHWAARMGHPEIAQCLLGITDPPTGGVPVDRLTLLRAVDKEGNTPIHLAASEPDSQQLALDLLTALEAEGKGPCSDVLRLQTKGGFSPLHLACSAGISAVVRRLLTLGAGLLAVTTAQETPLHLAIQSGDAEVLDALLGVESQAEDKWATFLTRADVNGNTGLHLCCQTGNLGAARKLLAHRCHLDLEARNKAGLTAAVVAHRAGRKPLVDLLKEHGAKFDEAALAKEVEAAPAPPRGDFSGVSKAGVVEPKKKPDTAVEEPAPLLLNPLLLALVAAFLFFFVFYLIFVRN